MIKSRLVIAAERFGVRIVHYCILSNHAHFIVEAADERSLARAMKGLLVRVARGLNGLWNRSGSVFGDHYHARALKTPREVRRALVYVLQNARKHGVQLRGLDPFSSASTFDGWREFGGRAIDALAARLARARTWLLAIGWRRHGRISIKERPAR